MESGKSGEKTKTVSGSDKANNSDFKNSFHDFVIGIANLCHYQKFSI